MLIRRQRRFGKDDPDRAAPGTAAGGEDGRRRREGGADGAEQPFREAELVRDRLAFDASKVDEMVG